MRIGVPREIKPQERRVGMTPSGVRELVRRGHDVLIERDAGRGVGATDDDYRAAGGCIAESAADVFAGAQLIVKVKEPQGSEWGLLESHHVLFAYLHLAADAELTDALVSSGATCIAYETVTGDRTPLPLLAPMSKIAGRLSIQAAARTLEAPFGGPGVLLGGVPGVLPASVVVIGGGTVGRNAVEMALGAGAQVTVLDLDVDVLDRLSVEFGPRLRTLNSSPDGLRDVVLGADVVVGAVLVPGDRAPRVVSEELVKQMRPGTVLVDVAIDQGGCFATSRPTTHEAPTYPVHDTIHYCVTNMPGAVPRTATQALTNATLPYVLRLADEGAEAALSADRHLRAGLSVRNGQLADETVARALEGVPR